MSIDATTRMFLLLMTIILWKSFGLGESISLL